MLFLQLYERRLMGTHTPIDQKLLAGSILPAGLFLIALLSSLRSNRLQKATAIFAGLTGILFVGGALLAVSTGFGHGTGLGGEIFALLAWLFGVGMSVVMLLIAVANGAWRTLRKTPDPLCDNSGRR
jgi:hypothetical protein